MIKMIIGTILILAGGIFLAVMISHGILFPHVLGPGMLVVIGVVLVAIKGKTG